ncbi:MAG: hypothetical protein H6736_07925 [Alphaproteobacteria bacterium]|nr:hypothetical protein [Alphaproteobacteria bacterium]
MIALLATSWALDCAEIANMGRAGVPVAGIVSELNASGMPVSMDDLGCLLAQRVDDDVVRAAARLNASQDDRPLVVAERSEPGVSRVRVELECGSVDVSPSDDGRVHVDGRLAAGGRLVWTPTADRLLVQVDLAGEAPGDADLPRFQGAPVPRKRLPCGDLTVRVPTALPVVLETTRAAVRMRGLAGSVDVTDHFGDVEIVGSSPDVRVRTTGGNVVTDTGARVLDVDTVSGRVVLGAGPGARVDVNSISGDIWVWGGPMERLEASAVSGRIRLFGGFAEGARASLVSHGGDIEARVPAGRIEVSSHEGEALGPERLQGAARAFASSAELGPAWAGLWNATPTRWWFPSGAVVSSTLADPSTDFELVARAFSGHVDVSTVTDVPAPTGPLVARLDGVQDRLAACGAAQHARSGGRGHAVATLVVDATGGVARLTAPGKADTPEALEDGALSACVVAALEGLAFDPGADTRVRWPVLFGPPVVLPDEELRANQLRALALQR